MYNKKKISLILPVYNEEKNIYNCIQEFLSLKIFDEIIAVDNNSSDNSEKLIKKTKALYLRENIQGYGAAIRKGLNSATGDLIVVCEPDGTFVAKDSLKLLKYMNQYDCVFGTRTSKKFIGKGAKMYFLLRIGNIIVAKFLSVMFPGVKLTDVGCTYKIFKKKCYKKIKKKLKVIGSELQPEIMIQLISQKYKIIEIPVRYKKRKGYSKITYNIFSTSILALKMIKLIIFLKIKCLFA
jgi:glycosyltransferase involved in cell wall biosynthesis